MTEVDQENVSSNVRTTRSAKKTLGLDDQKSRVKSVYKLITAMHSKNRSSNPQFTEDRIWAEVQKNPATAHIESMAELQKVLSQLEDGQQIMFADGRVTVI